jgi:hypothetical protein
VPTARIISGPYQGQPAEVIQRANNAVQVRLLDGRKVGVGDDTAWVFESESADVLPQMGVDLAKPGEDWPRTLNGVALAVSDYTGHIVEAADAAVVHECVAKIAEGAKVARDNAVTRKAAKDGQFF